MPLSPPVGPRGKVVPRAPFANELLLVPRRLFHHGCYGLNPTTRETQELDFNQVAFVSPADCHVEEWTVISSPSNWRGAFRLFLFLLGLHTGTSGLLLSFLFFSFFSSVLFFYSRCRATFSWFLFFPSFSCNIFIYKLLLLDFRKSACWYSFAGPFAVLWSWWEFNYQICTTVLRTN